jgi:hypothetical protein
MILIITTNIPSFPSYTVKMATQATQVIYAHVVPAGGIIPENAIGTIPAQAFSHTLGNFAVGTSDVAARRIYVPSLAEKDAMQKQARKIVSIIPCGSKKCINVAYKCLLNGGSVGCAGTKARTTHFTTCLHKGKSSQTKRKRNQF